jgi:hypothetical protein
MKYLYLFIVAAFSCCTLTAQVVLSPLPSATESFRLEDTWRIHILVSGNSTITGHLTVRIEDNSQNPVYTATLPNITLRPGTNNLQHIAVPGASSSFGQMPAATILRQTGALPYGEFIICYFLYDTKQTTIQSEYCYEKSVKPMLPPELLQPYDEEIIATVSPLLIWKAPFPAASATLTYALRLVEVKEGQLPDEAIEKNAPLVSRQYKDQTQLIYPADTRALEDGKTYAWRISVSSGDYTIGTTESWQFTVKQERIRPRNDSYRLLTDKPDGNVFIAKEGVLRFAYNNRYGADTLEYAIKALNSDKLKGGGKLPVIKMSEGMNKIDLDLNNTQMEAGKKYMLQIIQKNSNDQYLEFIYRKDG